MTIRHLSLAALLSCVISVVAAPKIYLRANNGKTTMEAGKQLELHLDVTENSERIIGGSIMVTINDSFGPTQFKQVFPLEGKALDWTWQPPQPGVYIVATSNLKDAEGKNIAPQGGHQREGVAYAVESLKPQCKEPADFDEFWSKGRNATKDAPVEMSDLPDNFFKNHKARLLKVKIGDETFTGVLSIPRKPGRYPAVLSIPGAGPGVGKPWIGGWMENTISLTMNVHRYPWTENDAERKQQLNDLTKEKGVQPQYINVTQPEKYYYYNVILAFLRALDTVAALPEYDGRHLVVTGSSQGGFLSLAMAALHPKVIATAVNVPAMCDHFGGKANRKAGWPTMLQMFPTAEKTAGYFDTVNFASRIKVPAFVAVGFFDTTAPAAGGLIAYNQLKGEKVLLQMPRRGHEIPVEYSKASVQFLNKYMQLP